MKQVIALVLASTAFISADAGADAPAVRVWDIGANVSEAIVEVHATPETIYRVVTNYAQWPRLFSDVREVSLLSGGPRDATVQFESQTLERRVTVRFDNGPESIRFRLVDGAPGVASTGKFIAEAGRDRSFTLVRGTLSMEATFPATLFVSSKKLAWMRQTKLSRDLDDLRKRFP